jgi:hypothetical protein
MLGLHLVVPPHTPLKILCAWLRKTDGSHELQPSVSARTMIHRRVELQGVPRLANEVAMVDNTGAIFRGVWGETTKDFF